MLSNPSVSGASASSHQRQPTTLKDSGTLMPFSKGSRSSGGLKAAMFNLISAEFQAAPSRRHLLMNW
jgi:hypothetical protein